jgi:spore coat polysaccharide biosynthesis protein SpsF
MKGVNLNDFVCVIQARMSSSRLPGKVLLKTKTVKEYTLISFLLDRISPLCKKGLEIVIATSTESEDDKIEKYVKEHYPYINVFRGDLNNVLSRYYNCVKKLNKKAVIRITSDCPFSDPNLILKMIAEFSQSKFDYISNTMPPDKSEFSDGFDVEIFSFNVLEECALNLNLNDSDREHVTFAMWKNSQYKSAVFPNYNKTNFTYKLSVDNQNDFNLFQRVISEIDINMPYYDIENFVNKEKLYLLNKESVKNSGWKK